MYSQVPDKMIGKLSVLLNNAFIWGLEFRYGNGDSGQIIKSALECFSDKFSSVSSIFINSSAWNFLKGSNEGWIIPTSILLSEYSG